MIKSIKILTLILCMISVISISHAGIWSEETDKVKVELITDAEKANSNELHALVKLTMKNDWHTYWKNPGDSGEKTKILWNMPSNYEAVLINQTAPETFSTEDIVQFGYGNVAYFYYKVLSDTNFQEPLELSAEWLACKDECVPEKIEIELNLANQPNLLNDDKFMNELEKAIFSFPQNIGLKGKYQITDDGLMWINADLPKSIIKLIDENTRFITNKEEIIYNSAPQKIGYNGENSISILADTEENIDDNLEGVFIIKDKAFEIVLTPQENLEIYPEIYQTNTNKPENILWIFAMAFIGGLILNFMPCIFPILTIKAISLAQSVNNARESRIEAIMYFLGVVISFLTIAAILAILRIQGEKIGWGFQLQSPIFITIMIVIFFVIFLLLLDIITFNNPIKSVEIQGIKTIQSKSSKWQKRSSAFATGLFSVLIASPCTAPFMGIAIGYTLAKPLYIYFPVFAALSIGYALPFTMVGFFPKYIQKILPKPGRWMIILKKIFAIPILITCIWLSWVLYSQLVHNDTTTSNTNVIWEEYNQEKVKKLVDSGEKVFIDFTAKWCITCLVNKKTVLDSDDFAQVTEEKNIHLFRADWTNDDEDIEAALKKYNRNSIPLYVYYPGENSNYVLLPQILTQQQPEEFYINRVN